MTSILKYAAAAALTGVLVVAATMPSEARHHQRKAKAAPVAVVVQPTPGFTGAISGSYYSSVYNPRFGYVPELGYSNAVSFRIYPLSD